VLAVFWNQGDSTAHGPAHASQSEGLGFEGDLPDGPAVEAEDGLGDLAAARADETGESDDFTGLDVEADVAELAG